MCCLSFCNIVYFSDHCFNLHSQSVVLSLLKDSFWLKKKKKVNFFVNFCRPDIDAWELRNGLNELYGKDLVPEPKIVIAMLHACRRLDDFSMTVRILESVKAKSAGSSEIYNYILKEVKPTIDELGLSTPEELGLA